MHLNNKYHIFTTQKNNFILKKKKMANLKIDLLNKLKNDKYYGELELIRLAQEPNMNYQNKIMELYEILRNIALINGSIALAEQYFVETQPQQVPQQEPQKPQQTPQPHQGQTHVE